MRRRRLARAWVTLLVGSFTLAACFFEDTIAGDPPDGGDANGDVNGDAEPGEAGAADGTSSPDDAQSADAPAVDGDPVDAPVDAAADGLAVTPPGIDGGKAFDFAPPYVATLGPSSRSDAGHNFAANTPRSNPWRTRCVDCHKAGGSAAARPFFAGGSVYRLVDGGPPAVMAEVRLKRFINANAVSAYTDNDGNWFVPLGVAQDAGVNFSLRPGIRDATRVRTMGPSPAIGVCNQCHGGANYL